MKFSFDINGVGKEVSFIKEETSAITGVESLIDSNIYGAEMTDANAEFNAIDVDMSIMVNGFEASGNKDNAAKKPGFFKRAWKAIKALFRALGKYIKAAYNWVKKKFKKDKVDKNIKEASTRYEDVANICKETRKENPNASEEEFAKKAKAKIDEKYGYGYGPEDVTIKEATPYMVDSIKNIVSCFAKPTEGGKMWISTEIDVEVVLPIEDDRIAGPAIIKAEKVLRDRTADIGEYPTMEELNKVMNKALATLYNSIQLVKLSNSKGPVEILEHKDFTSDSVDSHSKNFRKDTMNITRELSEVNPIVMHIVKIKIDSNSLTSAAEIEKAINKSDICRLNKKYYEVLYDAVALSEAFSKDMTEKDLDRLDDVILTEKYSGTPEDMINAFKENIKRVQLWSKHFVQSISREVLDKNEATSKVRAREAF